MSGPDKGEGGGEEGFNQALIRGKMRRAEAGHKDAVSREAGPGHKDPASRDAGPGHKDPASRDAGPGHKDPASREDGGAADSDPGHGQDAGSPGARLAGGRIPEGPVLGSGEPNRHGMPKLPPGQHEVKNWPVLDLGVQPTIPREHWTLSVLGQVEKPQAFDWKAFMALPQVEDVSDFHCVTSWSRMDNAWGGVRFRDVIAAAVPKAGATHAYMKAYDGYTVNLPLSECLDDDVLLVHTWEGIPLPREHGGPVRMITPRKWAWKGAKWIKEIHLLTRDMLGFWELRGYSNTAEPWADDRYS